jgi:hypothetical protein
LKPPQYGEGLAEEHCANCRFYDKTSKRSGQCTKYDVAVDWDKWCSSWTSKDAGQAAKDLWKQHRKALASAKEA